MKAHQCLGLAVILLFMGYLFSPLKAPPAGESFDFASKGGEKDITEEVLVLSRLAGEIRSELSELGNPRAQLIGHFAASSRRILEIDGGEENQKKVMALYQVYRLLIQDPHVRFWMGSEDRNISEKLQKLDQLYDSLKSKRAPGNDMLVGATVSYMRFVSNRIAASLQGLTADTAGANPRTLSLAKARNAYVPIPGWIAAYSFQVKEVDKILAGFAEIKKSQAWKMVQKVARETYVPLRDSNDIRGGDQEMENVISLKLGPLLMNLLFSTFQRAPSSLSPLQVADFPLSQLVFLEALTLNKPARHPTSTTTYANTILIGNIPGQYVNGDRNSYVLGAVEMRNRLIVAIEVLQADRINQFKLKNSGKVVIELKNNKGQHDVIYPGLIDLHDHTKQNNLPVWGLAKGQFENRFEWRDWDSYTKSVSQNMNPWIQFGKPIECAAFRWSEMQSMVVGTTYLQGPSSCVDDFGILRVEDKDSYKSAKSAVQAPTDIVIPNDFQFVWQTLRPIIQQGKTYEEAIAQVVGEYCPDLREKITAENVSKPSGIKILQDQDLLQKSCPDTREKPLPAKFVRYIYWIHSGIEGKKNYLLDKQHSAVVAHLAEGRRKDAYNMREYQIIKLLGLDLPNMNFVHGVGIDKPFLKEMAKKNMGLVWSPFSNLILYAETLDIKAAHEVGVTMAMGSDWLPTGSKGPLEEAKLAAQYIDKDVNKEGLKTIFTDEYLYQMITENPAKLINHWENSTGEAGIGRIAVGSMGSLIVTSLLDPNPYTNLIRKVNEENLNLVVIDGNPIYGNTEYLDQAKLPFETMSKIDTTVAANSIVLDAPPADKAGASMMEHLVKIGKDIKSLQMPVTIQCQFSSDKGFVTQNTNEPEIRIFDGKTGLNLDRFSDIFKLLAANAMSQSLNKTSKEGNLNFATSYFPSLYSCNDTYHKNRIRNQVQSIGTDDWSSNLNERTKNRSGFGKGPKTLGDLYR